MSEMIADTPGFDLEIPKLLKTIHLFKDLSDQDITQIAVRLQKFAFEKDEYLFRQRDIAESFYIILSGSIWLSKQIGERRKASEITIGKVVRGDYLGEMGLVQRKLRNATARMAENTVVLRMTGEQFRWMVSNYPVVAERLYAAIRSYQLANRHPFSWLSDDEPIHLITRRHIIHLWLGLFFPSIVMAAAAGIYLVGVNYAYSIVQLVGGLIFTGGLFWALWNALDWTNDYFIVTDRRVVWVEEVFGLLDTRNEAPLNQVLAVDVNTSLWQRIFGIGDVVVRTFTGKILATDIGNPEMYRGPILEYKERVKQVEAVHESEELDQRIAETLQLTKPAQKPEGEQTSSTAQDPLATPGKKPTPTVEKSSIPKPLRQLFLHFLKVRYEEDGVITYRKHWFLLFWRVWIYLAAFALVGLAILLYMIDWFTLIPLEVLLYTLLLVFIVSLPFAGYQYLDWRNDKYELTDKDIIDLEKKPLGREVRKSAPLVNILSIENRREGIIGLLLNFGVVVINIGDTSFNFIGVHKPQNVQQEIFDRKYRLENQMKKDAERKRDDEMLQWLSRYHKAVKDRYVSSDPYGDSE